MFELASTLKSAVEQILQNKATVGTESFIFTRAYDGDKIGVIRIGVGTVVWAGENELNDNNIMLLLELLNGKFKEVGESIQLRRLLAEAELLVQLWERQKDGAMKSKITFLKSSANEAFVVEENDFVPRRYFRFNKFQKIKLPGAWTWSAAQVVVNDRDTALSPDACSEPES